MTVSRGNFIIHLLVEIDRSAELEKFEQPARVVLAAPQPEPVGKTQEVPLVEDPRQGRDAIYRQTEAEGLCWPDAQAPQQKSLELELQDLRARPQHQAVQAYHTPSREFEAFPVPPQHQAVQAYHTPSREFEAFPVPPQRQAVEAYHTASRDFEAFPVPPEHHAVQAYHTPSREFEAFPVPPQHQAVQAYHTPSRDFEAFPCAAPASGRSRHTIPQTENSKPTLCRPGTRAARDTPCAGYLKSSRSRLRTRASGDTMRQTETLKPSLRRPGSRASGDTLQIESLKRSRHRPSMRAPRDTRQTEGLKSSGHRPSTRPAGDTRRTKNLKPSRQCSRGRAAGDMRQAEVAPVDRRALKLRPGRCWNARTKQAAAGRGWLNLAAVFISGAVIGLGGYAYLQQGHKLRDAGKLRPATLPASIMARPSQAVATASEAVAANSSFSGVTQAANSSPQEPPPNQAHYDSGAANRAAHETMAWPARDAVLAAGTRSNAPRSSSKAATGPGKPA